MALRARPLEIRAGHPRYVRHTPRPRSVIYRGQHVTDGGLRYPPRSGGVERRYSSDNGRAPTASTAGPWGNDAAPRRHGLHHKADSNNRRWYPALLARS